MTPRNLALLLWISCLGCTKAAPVSPPSAESAASAHDSGPTAVEQAASAQKTATAGLRSKLTPGFVVIPAGRYAMGQADREVAGFNDAAQHPVVISQPFEMMAREVTVEDYRSLMATSEDQRKGCDKCPVTHVSWYQAATYCNALSQRNQLPPCYTIEGLAVVWPGPQCAGYRLPTEAEWEYAARAGSDAPQYGPAADIAWYDENSQLKVHPVGEKKPNAFGLYDMLGNVAEWVWDWQGEYPKRTVSDPMGPASGQNRVFRGGSCRYGDGEATAGFRNGFGPQNQVEFIGFRCVRTLPASP